LTIDEYQELIHLAVTDLGKADLFLGYEWFMKHNPEIDWTKGEIRLERCPEECREIYFGEELEDEIEPIEKIEKKEQILMINTNSRWMQIQQRAFQMVSSRLAEEEEKKKGKEEEFEKKYQNHIGHSENQCSEKNHLISYQKKDPGIMQSN
jgi:hypothetical protein